jgi:hypothetical protein
MPAYQYKPRVPADIDAVIISLASFVDKPASILDSRLFHLSAERERATGGCRNM